MTSLTRLEAAVSAYARSPPTSPVKTFSSPTQGNTKLSLFDFDLEEASDGIADVRMPRSPVRSYYDEEPVLEQASEGQDADEEVGVIDVRDLAAEYFAKMKDGEA
jgi:hypothetical protein